MLNLFYDHIKIFFNFYDNKSTNFVVKTQSIIYRITHKSENKNNNYSISNIKSIFLDKITNVFFPKKLRDINQIIAFNNNNIETYLYKKYLINSYKILLKKNNQKSLIIDNYNIVNVNRFFFFYDKYFSFLKNLNFLVFKIRKPSPHVISPVYVHRDPYIHEYSNTFNNFQHFDYSDFCFNNYKKESEGEFLNVFDIYSLDTISRKPIHIYDLNFYNLFKFKRYLTIKEIRNINLQRAHVENREQIDIYDFHTYTENTFNYKDFKTISSNFQNKIEFDYFKVYDNNFNFFIKRCPYITLDYKLPRYYYYWDSKKDKLIYDYNLGKNKIFNKNNLLNDCSTKYHYKSWDNIPRISDPNPFEWKLMNDWMWEETWSTSYSNKENDYFLVWFHRLLEDNFGYKPLFFDSWYFCEYSLSDGWITDNLIGFYYVIYILWGPMDVIWCIWKYFAINHPVEFWTWFVKWRCNWDFYYEDLYLLL